MFYLRHLIILILPAITANALAANIENGKALHDANCVRCHQSEVYTRDNRMVNSYAELHERVRQCEIMAEMAWFEEEIEDVVSYLNETYYKFDRIK